MCVPCFLQYSQKFTILGNLFEISQPRMPPGGEFISQWNVRIVQLEKIIIIFFTQFTNFSYISIISWEYTHKLTISEFLSLKCPLVANLVFYGISQ